MRWRYATRRDAPDFAAFFVLLFESRRQLCRDVFRQRTLPEQNRTPPFKAQASTSQMK